MEQLFSQYGRIITSRILVDQVTGEAAREGSPGRGTKDRDTQVGREWRNKQQGGGGGVTQEGAGPHEALAPHCRCLSGCGVHPL